MFERYKEDLIRIEKSEVFSYRHNEYCKGGIARDLLDEKCFVSPFTDAQLDLALRLLETIWMRNLAEDLENSNYVWKVIVPEFLIRVSFIIIAINE